MILYIYKVHRGDNKMSYSTKQVSDKFNVTMHTLRYYEKEGLLPKIKRDANGNREYSDVDLEWLCLIRCMRTTGMSIFYIKNYIDLCKLGKDTLIERRQIIVNQKEIIVDHIKELNGHLAVINKKLKHYDEIIVTKQEDGYNLKNLKAK